MSYTISGLSDSGTGAPSRPGAPPSGSLRSSTRTEKRVPVSTKPVINRNGTTAIRWAASNATSEEWVKKFRELDDHIAKLKAEREGIIEKQRNSALRAATLSPVSASRQLFPLGRNRSAIQCWP